MKKSIPALFLVFLFLSCSKKDKWEGSVISPAKGLVGTTWERYLTRFSENNKDLYNYLYFKTVSELEFSSKFDKDELIADPVISPYSYENNQIVYRSEGYNYTGTFSGDTLKVVGTAGILIFIKVK